MDWGLFAGCLLLVALIAAPFLVLIYLVSDDVEFRRRCEEMSERRDVALAAMLTDDEDAS